jgi:hypothetical protein
MQKSRLVLVPSEFPRPKEEVSLPSASSFKESALPDGGFQKERYNATATIDLRILPPEREMGGFREEYGIDQSFLRHI